MVPYFTSASKFTTSFQKLGAVQNDCYFLRQLLRLYQRQDLEKLVHRSESARKDHQRLRQIGEPELAHEEVMEFEVQFVRDVRIRPLLERQTDVQTDGLALARPSRRDWRPP